MTNVPICALPSSLVSLAITESYLPFNWFQPLSMLPHLLPNLKELDLSRSSKTWDADLGHIARAWSGLTALKLNHCYRVTAEGLQSVAGLRQLEVLEIAGTQCDGMAVHHICRNLAATLRRLSVAECSSFDDGCAGTVAEMLTNLQSLDVSKCSRLSDDGLLVFTQLNANVRHLNVSSTVVSCDTLAQLKNILPSCDIVGEVLTSVQVVPTLT